MPIMSRSSGRQRTWEVQEGPLQQLLAVCCIQPTGAHVTGPHQHNVQGWDGVLQLQVVLPQQQEFGIPAYVNTGQQQWVRQQCAGAIITPEATWVRHTCVQWSSRSAVSSVLVPSEHNA
jgi:hypothetical protein